MCGIFGSSNFGIFSTAFAVNQERGNFASGTYYVSPGNTLIRKNEANYNITGQYAWYDLESYRLYLGHAQAPTGAFREWSADTTHPFEIGDWVVAHNGVLENHTQLNRVYDLQGTNEVDSSTIPALLTERYAGDDVFCIAETAELLKGTFACWLYSKHTEKAYIIRSGSTLYCDPETNTFSSLPLDEVCEEIVEQGVIYELTVEGITQVGEFKQDSPFLIL